MEVRNELVDEIIKYLAGRPYIEVATLLNEMQKDIAEYQKLSQKEVKEKNKDK